MSGKIPEKIVFVIKTPKELENEAINQLAEKLNIPFSAISENMAGSLAGIKVFLHGNYNGEGPYHVACFPQDLENYNVHVKEKDGGYEAVRQGVFYENLKNSDIPFPGEDYYSTVAEEYGEGELGPSVLIELDSNKEDLELAKRLISY